MSTQLETNPLQVTKTNEIEKPESESESESDSSEGKNVVGVEGGSSQGQKKAKGINLSKSKKRKRKEKDAKNEENQRKPSRPSSWVWNHFTEIKNSDPKFPRAACNWCGHSYACHKKNNGTSSMAYHLQKQCKKYPRESQHPSQKMLSFQPKKKEDGEGKGGTLSAVSFNPSACREALARMIIVDELPFKHVEGEGFRYFMSIVLTAHFIDSNWNLHKRILNFCPIENHKGETIGETIENCLLEWGIEKVFTITVDNAASNDGAVNYLRGKINDWNGNVLRGEYLHVRCVAHILNLVVKDGLKDMDESIIRIRNAVRFVRASPARLKRFKDCVDKEKIQSFSLIQLDVPTRWNSTYIMLESALKFEKAFSRYEKQDANYVLEHIEDGKRIGIPSTQDWGNARVFVKFLKIFYDVTNAVSGSLFVSSSNYFHEFCVVLKTLKHWCESDDEHLKRMAERMKQKHDKYWGDVEKFNILLFIAVVLDPCYKFKFVEWSFGKIYDSTVADSLSWKVKSGFYKMYDHYKLSFGSKLQQVSSQSFPQQTQASKEEDDKKKFAMEFENEMKEQTCLDNKTEVDQYLFEAREKVTSQFDILNWWKVNSTRFPTLALMARDVLAMPISTVASESAFSTGGRVIDTYRSSLAPKTVEALICAQNWFRSKPLSTDLEELAEDIEKLQLGVGPSTTSEKGKNTVNIS